MADTGDRQHPPTRPFPAAVRVVAASPGAPPQLVSQYLTQVQPLMGVTGLGPWGLDPGRAWGFNLDGNPAFFWLEPTTSLEVTLVGVRLHDPEPTVLVSNSSKALWVAPAGTGEAAAISSTHPSGPPLGEFEVRCAATH